LHNGYDKRENIEDVNEFHGYKTS